MLRLCYVAVCLAFAFALASHGMVYLLTCLLALMGKLVDGWVGDPGWSGWDEGKRGA